MGGEQALSLTITGDSTAAVAALSRMTTALGATAAAGTFAQAGILAAGLAVVGLGVTAAKTAADYEAATQKMIATTGATGATAKQLESDFSSVAKNTIASFDSVGSALTQFHDKLGMTGGPLADIATKSELLAQVTRTNADTVIPEIVSAFSLWHTATKDMSGELDFLLHVSQTTGAPLDALLSSVKALGPSMSTVGFSLNETALILGAFARAGIAPEQATQGLRMALMQLGKQAQPTADAMGKAVDANAKALIALHEAENNVAKVRASKTASAADAQIAEEKLTLANDNYVKAAGALGQAQIAASTNSANLHDRFLALISQIEKAPDKFTAVGIASQYFGRGIGAMVAAAQAGAFNLPKLNTEVNKHKDTVWELARKTEDLGQKTAYVWRGIQEDILGPGSIIVSTLKSMEDAFIQAPTWQQDIGLAAVALVGVGIPATMLVAKLQAIAVQFGLVGAAATAGSAEAVAAEAAIGTEADVVAAQSGLAAAAAGDGWIAAFLAADGAVATFGLAIYGLLGPIAVIAAAIAGIQWGKLAGPGSTGESATPGGATPYGTDTPTMQALKAAAAAQAIRANAKGDVTSSTTAGRYSYLLPETPAQLAADAQKQAEDLLASITITPPAAPGLADTTKANAAKAAQNAYVNNQADFTRKVAALRTQFLTDEKNAWKKYDDEVNNRAAGIATSTALFDAVKTSSYTNAATLAFNLQTQVSQLQNWRDAVDVLKSRGMSAAIISAIMEQGPSKANDVLALAQSSDAGLANYTALYNQRAALSKATAKTELKPMLGQTTADIATMRDSMNAQYSQLVKEFTARNVEIGRGVTSGLTSGINAEAPTLYKTVTQMATINVIGALNGALEIHSPSQVMFRSGQDTSAGLLGGMDAGLKGTVTGGKTPASIGHSVATGVAGGIRAGIPEAMKAATSLTTQVMDAVAKVLGTTWTSKTATPAGPHGSTAVGSSVGGASGVGGMIGGSVGDMVVKAITGVMSSPGFALGLTGSGSLASLVADVQKYLGIPYVWGGESLSGFDCSGLMQYMAVHDFNIPGFPRTAAEQYAWLIGQGRGVALNQLQPGDQLFFDHPVGHTGMYVGNGMMIDAPHTGANVRYDTIAGRDFAGAGRWPGFSPGGLSGTAGAQVQDARGGWQFATASTFGGPGDLQSVAGPYPPTAAMNAQNLPYYAEGWTPVGHPEWPFGTKTTFAYHGKQDTGFLADRGPGIASRFFDLGYPLANALGFSGVDTVGWRKAAMGFSGTFAGPATGYMAPLILHGQEKVRVLNERQVEKAGGYAIYAPLIIENAVIADDYDMEKASELHARHIAVLNRNEGR